MACEAERPSGPPPPAVFELARVLARAAVARDLARLHDSRDDQRSMFIIDRRGTTSVEADSREAALTNKEGRFGRAERETDHAFSKS